MTNKEFFIETWTAESKVTSKSFRALPTDMNKLNHKHHPKSRSPWEIVNHIGPHGKEIHQAITTGRMDLVNEGQFDINGSTIYASPEAAAKERVPARGAATSSLAAGAWPANLRARRVARDTRAACARGARACSRARGTRPARAGERATIQGRALFLRTRASA